MTNIVPLYKTPNKKEAQRIICELVAKNLVSFSKHARERMAQRNINIPQVLTCLLKGKVVEEPVLANKGGESSGYEVVIERSTAGDYLRICVCLRFSQTALIVTAMKVK